MNRDFLTAIGSLLVCQVAVAADSDGRQQFADSIAEDLVHGRHRELYKMLDSDLANSLPEVKFLGTIESMTKSFGTIRTYTFKQEERARYIPTASKPIHKFWYKVVTTRYTDGCYLFVEVTHTTPLRVTACATITFPTGPPAELK